MATKKIIIKRITLQHLAPIAEPPEILIDTGKSKLLLYPNFIGDKLVEYTDLSMQLPLIERPEIRIFGKICHQQRNVGFFAMPGVSGYKYSGQQTTVIDIRNHIFLQDIMSKVNTVLDSEFNGVLVNLYENGERYISSHSDDEAGLSPVGVAAIAMGAVRTFRIRDKKTKTIIKDIAHNPGDLLIMTGEFQKEFKHEIPIEKTVKNARVSLTFRMHK